MMSESSAVLDIPRFGAVIVCSSGAVAICTFSERGELGFTEKGLVPGQRTNVSIACVVSAPACLFLHAHSVPIPCCRMRSVSWLEFGQKTVANIPTPFFMQT